jgi:hypothetical protein
MKKLSAKLKARMLKAAEKKERRRLRFRYRQMKLARALKSFKTILAPTTFRLFEPRNRSGVIRFIEELKAVILKDQINALIDFRQTKSFHADGALLFLAELDRIMRYTIPRPLIRCLSPRNRKASQVLAQIGVYRLLRSKTKAPSKEPDVVNWRVAHGVLAEGGVYDEVLGAFDGRIADPLRSKLFNGLTEAMTNVIQHAYLTPRKDGFPTIRTNKDWWMFSQERDGILSVVFCDLGIGIPNSLPVQNPGLMSSIAGLLRGRGVRATDNQIIRSVVRYSLSRFLRTVREGAHASSSPKVVSSRMGEPHRGRGLGQIAAVTHNYDTGSVAVFSNFGVYARTGKKEQDRLYRESIYATLISWRFPLMEGSGT